jgi:hypothetical protein
MAKIEVLLNELTPANGVTEEMLANADKASIHRDYFVAGKTYGTTDDKVGKWESRKVAFKEGGKVVSVVFAVCYVVNDKTMGCLTKSFLLSEGRCNNNGEVVAARGDVRQWADENLVDGVLASEWTKSLAELLNQRGLIMEKEKYQQAKKAGGDFVATYMHPHFADTYEE